MLLISKARAAARALTFGVPKGLIVGAVIGTFLGAGFLAGGLAEDIATQRKAARIAAAAGGDFSEAGFNALASGDERALAMAMRLAPSLLAGGNEPDRQDARQAAKRNVSHFLASVGPAARPWIASPLDEARQLDCLTQAVYYEARGETPAGQAAVAQVVLNRVRHPAFPKSICAVVFQGAHAGRGCQFSFACNGVMRARREESAWGRARRVAERALDGYVMNDVGNATHFHVTTVRPAWGNLLRVSQIGMHVFYRFGGKSGSPRSFVSPPQPEASDSLPIIAASMTIVPDDSADSPPAPVDTAVKVEVQTGAPAAKTPAVKPAAEAVTASAS